MHGPVIDAHVHVFNAGFAFREAVAMGWAMLWGNYPHHTGSTTRVLAGPSLHHDLGWRRVVEYVAGLVRVASQSAAANHAFEQQAFTRSRLAEAHGAALAVAPLMMDIYFACDNNADEQHGARHEGRPHPPHGWGVAPDQEAPFGRHVDDVARDVLAAIDRTPPGAPDSAT